jgi:uncharacterized protein YndB with AHSA1/START domain
MPTFVLTYRMPTDYVPGRPDTVAAWTAWFESMGDSITDIGNPVFESAELGNCGSGTRLGGYSFVTADDLESAVAVAKGSPAIDAGGGVEVGVVTVLHLDPASGGQDRAAEPSQPRTDYHKTIRVKASPRALFEALTSVSGLAAWWTPATGSGKAGGDLRFFMGSPEPMCVMHVDEATPRSVRWTVTECSPLPDWVGTRPTFTITPVDDDETELRFRHHGLTAELDCIQMCARSWDHYLQSLKGLIEAGEGLPVGSAADDAWRSGAVKA